MTAITARELEIILDSTHDGILAVNEEGIVTLFNKAAERITGLRHDDVVGRSAAVVIPNTRLPAILKEGNPEINREQNLGNTIIITSRMPLRNESGTIIGAVAVFRDITEIRGLMEKITGLWNVRSLLEAVIESTADAISVADEHGNNIIVNPAYTRITGLPKEAVLSKPATVDIAEGESMHLKVLRSGKPVRNVRMKVGPLKKEVIVNVAPIRVEGKIRGSVGVIHDISEIIGLTEELAHARKLIRRLEARYTWDDIVGTGAALTHAKEQAMRAAGTPATVLLRGESGTGKELFAHAIHNASSRSNGQFVRVNCAALPEQLLESELFGYEEGAFTGAARGGKRGLFEEASRGTLFLDEIGDITMPLQKKLLRVLQEKEIMKVGSTLPIPVDVRVIAATNADLERKIKDGSFREDLYYRLNVLPIEIPPLRSIRDDLPLIANHALMRLNQDYGRQVERITGEAMKALQDYPWPGNVRELESIIGRAMINMNPAEKVIEVTHLPLFECERIEQIIPGSEGPVLPLSRATAEAEKTAIERALHETGGNREKAAQLLGTAVRNLYYKIKKYRIKIRDDA
ncbi:MAG TPA: sigma-54-dependent Fis family transcriptional regulator [Nitrospirota bacterium]|nr:sigma-54-dependent Fis family transcriptional regulator [Nitrospirota bacterium]